MSDAPLDLREYGQPVERPKLNAARDSELRYSNPTSPYSGGPVSSRLCIVTPLGVELTSASRKLDGVRP